MFVTLAREEVPKVLFALRDAVYKSRFTAELTPTPYKNKPAIYIKTIRLRNKKDYCGQHPGPCQVNPLFKKKHLSGRWLEGADWIGWNDGLNDVLDTLQIGADVWSHNREAGKIVDGWAHGISRYFIRRGRRRRVAYDSEWCQPLVYGNGFNFWVEGTDEDFVDYCGKKAPRSAFMEGTPGIACWTLE